MDPITFLNIANTGWNMLNNDSQRQQQYQLDLMKQQYQYNSQAMRQQIEGQKELFDYTSYAHRVQQLKEAGLNPGLIYSGGAGGGGVTGNISAPQVSQGSAPNVASSTANKTAQIGMALQLAKLQSEIDVNKSVAEANKAQAEMTAGVQTQKATAEIGSIKASTDLIAQQTNSEVIKQNGWSIENDFNKIRNEIASKTKDYDIDRISALSKEAYYSMQKTMEEASSAGAKAKVDQATINTTIAQYNANVKKTLADILVAESQNKVNQERANQIVNEITQRYQEIKQGTYKLAQGDKQLIIEVEKLKNELSVAMMNNAAAMDRVKTEKWFDIAGTIIKSVGGATLTQ